MAPEDTNPSNLNDDDTKPGDTSPGDTSPGDTSSVENTGTGDAASPSPTLTPGAATSTTLGPDAPQASDEPVAAPAPARKRAPRATKTATKKAAAPAAADAEAVKTSPLKTAASKTAVKATAPKTARASRSATKKATKSAVQEMLPDESTEGPDSAEAPGEVATVKKTARKRATRKQAAPAVSSDVSEAVRELVTRSTEAAEAPVAEELDELEDPLGSAETSPVTGPARPETGEKAGEADTASEPQNVAPAALSVLFQAPDANTPVAKAPGRRRRAAAPAGAPGTHETAVVVAPESRTREDPDGVEAVAGADQAENGESPETAEASETTETTKTTATSETTERPSRRSRSGRGGRTKRGQDTSDASGDVGAVGAEDAGDAGDAGDGDRTSDGGDAGRGTSDSGPSADREGDPADDDTAPRRSRRRRGGKGRRGRGGSDEPETEPVAASATGSARRDDPADSDDADDSDDAGDSTGTGRGASAARSSDDEQGEEESASSRRRRRRRRSGGSPDGGEESPSVSTRVRQPRAQNDEPVAVRGSTRLEAKKQRRREGREAGRRRTIITEAEFLARREAVDRVMVVRNKDGRTQMGVLEDGVLAEHYIDQATNVSMAGNIYLGRVQNVLPSMEAAFVDIGKGRNAVLYAGEVNWDAAGLEGNQPKRIENALGSGQAVLVQVTKDPIGHKGARLTSQISLPGRYLVYVPNSSMTGISRKLPDTERARLKKILRDVVPESAGVIVRTAAEGASEAELRADVERLTATWETISSQADAATSGKAGKSKGRKKNGGSGSSPVSNAPALLHGEPDLTVRVIRDVFNEDFSSLVVSGDQAWDEIHPYITSVAPDLAERVTRWTGDDDLFTHHRVDEQLAKAMDRKVWLPSGGSLVIDRTEAMTVVDVNTGKFVGSGGNLEETVTKNNIEAAEEIVRQLRLRDIGGIIVVDFIDMVLESNRDLVVRRLLECLGRDRTKHQVAEVTSLGLVQMTRKRVGSGLIEVFGETCTHCNGRGFIIHSEPVDRGATSNESAASGSGSASGSSASGSSGQSGRSAQSRRGGRGSSDGGRSNGGGANDESTPTPPEPPKHNGPTAAQIAAAAHAAALKTTATHPVVEVAEASASIADDLAAELAASATSIGIDRMIEAEISSPPDTSFPADARDPANGAGTGATEPTEPTETTADQAPGRTPEPSHEPAPEASANTLADTPADPPAEAPQAPEAPAARGRRRRGRVVAPAGPPRAAGGSDTGGGTQA